MSTPENLKQQEIPGFETHKTSVWKEIGSPKPVLEPKEDPKDGVDDDTQPYDPNEINKHNEGNDEEKPNIKINKTSTPEQLYGAHTQEPKPHWSDK